MDGKEILIVAGPNGAGKTTFALDFLNVEARGLAFVNADLIAAGLAPMEPWHADIRAGRLMLTELDRLAAEGRSFAFETTLSGRGYLRKIRRWRSHGYRVRLVFLSLPSIDDAIARVQLRVSRGGHNVPEDVIQRRFRAGFDNFRREYSAMVDEWILFDNQRDEPRVLEWSIRID